MQVQISGKHVDVGEALRARVADEIALSIGKYFDRGGDADVVISKKGYAFRVDCSVKLASGQQLLSHGSGGDAHMAFDQALAKIETRIRRYKRRLKSHTEAATAKQAENAAFYVLRAPEDDHEDDMCPRPSLPVAYVHYNSPMLDVVIHNGSMQLLLVPLYTFPLFIYSNIIFNYRCCSIKWIICINWVWV